MRYFEFNRGDYYALLAVKDDKFPAFTGIKAEKLYVEHVAYENIYELRREGVWPEEITKKEAYFKFLTAGDNENFTVKKLKEQFEKCEDYVLLIDSSLG